MMDKIYKFLSILGEEREGTVADNDPDNTACKLTEWTGVPWKVADSYIKGSR